MVVYDNSKFSELIINLSMGLDDKEYIKELFKFFDSKLHDIYRHINNLDSKIDKVVEKLSNK